MYNPINLLLEDNPSIDEIKTTFNVAAEGINAIADILYCSDLSGIDKNSLSGLGAALLALNGVVDVSVEKIEKLSKGKVA